MDLEQLIQKAEASRFGMWKLNFLLHRVVPFNRPHNLKILAINKQKVKIEIPYKKSNLNHIKGLHACGLATVAEYSSGILLLYNLGVKKYRIIMETIKVDYFYQGKTNAFATYELSTKELENSIILPIEKDGKVSKECKIEVKDEEGNLLCIATTSWQIKPWDQVKTKL